MKYLKKYWMTILSFIFVFILISYGFQSILEGSHHQQKESLEKALRRGILQCYAQEGHYPESLDYLIEHYHILYNKESFDVKYEIFASNMMPNITIIEKR
jgi:hypothetical protein